MKATEKRARGAGIGGWEPDDHRNRSDDGIEQPPAVQDSAENSEDEEDEKQEQDEGDTEGPMKKKSKGPLTLKSIEKFKQKVDRTGVVYISRVPPYMKPEKIRHLLGRHADVGRVFLTPEDPAVRKRRKAKGGNKRPKYVDGWIEFMDKREAKEVAKGLNTQPIGGRATSFYSADIWNLKYLSGFKWRHLTEKIAYDNQVRRQKLQAEIAQAKREKDFYMDRVDQNKRINSKAKKQSKASEAEKGQIVVAGGGETKVLRTFRQSKALGAREEAAGDAPQKSGSALLSRIFGTKA